MPAYRPVGCKCAGYNNPRFDPRIKVGPGPHPKLPQDFDKLVGELLKNIEKKNNLFDTRVKYVHVGEPIPLPPNEDEDPFEPALLQNHKIGMDEGK